MYVTDCLRMTGENTARFAGGNYLKARWIDLINPKPEEIRTEEEIKQHIKEILNNLKG